MSKDKLLLPKPRYKLYSDYKKEITDQFSNMDEPFELIVPPGMVKIKRG